MSGQDLDIAMEQANHRGLARNPNHDRILNRKNNQQQKNLVETKQI